MAEMSEQLEEVAMGIIANAGAGRSSSFEGLKAAKEGDFSQADMKMAEAEGYLSKAHKTHLELLQMDATGQIESCSVLLAHAQDHMMCATLANELIAELVAVYRTR